MSSTQPSKIRLRRMCDDIYENRKICMTGKEQECCTDMAHLVEVTRKRSSRLGAKYCSDIQIWTPWPNDRRQNVTATVYWQLRNHNRPFKWTSSQTDFVNEQSQTTSLSSRITQKDPSREMAMDSASPAYRHPYPPPTLRS